MLVVVTADLDSTLIDAWRPRRVRLAWSFVSAGVIAVVLGAVAGASVRGGDAIGVVLSVVMTAVLVVVVGRAIRYSTARLEFRSAGLTAVSLGRRTSVAWDQLARVEVADLDFPGFCGRAHLVLVLTDRKRVPLWVTERSSWSQERRMEPLERQIGKIRAVRHGHSQPPGV